jgi:hypothetical protein
MAFLMMGRLQAQINWLNDDRYVTVSGYAQITPEVSSNYFATATPPSSFAAFNGNISQAANESNPDLQLEPYSNSQATQNSSWIGSEFNFSSSVVALTAGGPGEGQQLCYGVADSFCQVSFSVNSSETWNLALDFNEHSGNLTADWDLISSQSGSILGNPVQNPDPNGPPLYYQGTLTPGDIYTFILSLSAYQNQPDPIGDSSIAGIGATLSVVPEPSSYALMGMGLAVFYSWQKKVFHRP